MTASAIIIILLIIHILQNDARLWQVTKEIKALRKDLAKKP
jgi:cell division protein FtsL